MRKLLIAAGVLPLLACSAADLEQLQTETDPVTELSHTVTARMYRGAVILTVTRQLHNDTVSYQQLTHTLVIPDAAVVTSFKAGSEAALLDADEASTRWSELISPGEAEPTTSAMLQWTYTGDPELEVFGFAPGATLAIEYTLQLPPVYDSGRWVIDYPLDGSPGWPSIPPVFDVSRIAGAGVEELEGAFRVTAPRGTIDRTDTKWALYRLDEGRTMWRLELDAAQILEPAPARPNVVFVIDASHTEGPEGIEAQLQVLAPYLANVPDAQVEIVLYRRFAERLFGRFVPATDVARLLAATPKERLAPGNGSNLELGAKLAVEALSTAPGLGRVVLLTDGELREGFSNELASGELAKAPRETVVHVVLRNGNNGHLLEESRDDDHPLAPIAAATGGVFFRLDGIPEDPKQAAETMLGLVRPIRIDGFQIEASGLESDRLDVPDTLIEGATLRYAAIAPHPPAQVTLTGKIWGREYRKVVPVDPDLTLWMPGLAIGLNEIESQLTDDEVRAAAWSIGAVSRVTTYLSAKPQAGPSLLGQWTGGTGGYGISGCDCRGVSTHSTGCSGYGVAGPPPDYEGLIRELLAPGVAACVRAHGADEKIGSVTLEATWDEIVDVKIGGMSPALDACVTEVVWAARLPPIFNSRRSYEVEL
jgi:hypothetical protein